MASGTYPTNGPTVCIRSDYAYASLSTAISGNNNDLVYTAKEPGAQGNDITITYVLPDDDNQAHALAITVDGTDIEVSLAVDTDGSTVLTTGDLLKTAIAADDAANALVSVADKAANDGSGVLVAMSGTPLSGGTGGEEVNIVSKSFDGRNILLEDDTEPTPVDYIWSGQGARGDVEPAA